MNPDLREKVKGFLCHPSSALACVGTELRRDDAAGLVLCRMLRDTGFPASKLIECPYGLENCLNEIIERRVEKLLIADATLPQPRVKTPYFIAGLDKVSAGFLATTHNIPIPMLITYLRMNKVASDVGLLGIVADDLSFGEGLTERVNEAVKELAVLLKSAVEECSEEPSQET